jgi:hypothetical protein
MSATALVVRSNFVPSWDEAILVADLLDLVDIVFKLVACRLPSEKPPRASACPGRP